MKRINKGRICLLFVLILSIMMGGMIINQIPIWVTYAWIFIFPLILYFPICIIVLLVLTFTMLGKRETKWCL